jgi:hypothetical protein
MISLLLGVCVIVLWRQTIVLRRRIERLEATSPRPNDARPTAAAIAPVPIPAPSAFTPAPVAVTAPTDGPPRDVIAPAIPAVVASEPSVTDRTMPDATSPAASQGWEVVVGSSWLNKAGVLIFVTGLALLLGYSMAHVGPLGRVAMGFGIAGAMLAAGVLIERRPANQSYGHGLVAGGWAGIYVTTFAMRALPAARVIDSDLVATLLLLAVASVMVWHSLRYRSQTVTSLAYLAASLPLALTPLSTFSLVAALPLAVSLLLVAQRSGWSGLSFLGVGSTYLLFALRASGGASFDLDSSLRYALLASYWLTFEIADISSDRARRHGRGAAPQASIFPANAIGSIGCLLLLEPFDDPTRGAVTVGCAALAYFGAAIVRARMRPTPTESERADRPFDTSHAALAVSAALMAWALDMRFDGQRTVIALLLEAQLLVFSALVTGDRHVRRIGTAVAALVTIQAFVASANAFTTRIDWPWQMSSWAPTLGLIAVCWYFNYERLRHRGVRMDLPERLYPWVASAFVAAIIGQDVPIAYAGLVTMVFAFALLAAGTRPAAEYRYQAYIALVLGVRAALVPFAPVHAPVSPAAEPALFAATAMAYIFAWWAMRRRAIMPAGEQQLAAIEAGAACVALLMAFEWRMTPRPWLGCVWASTALVLTALGGWRRISGLRWQSYALAAAASVQGFVGIALYGSQSTTASAVTVAALYATGLLSRRGVRHSVATGEPSAQVDRAARIGVIVWATLLLTVLLADRLSANLITMAWGLQGIVLLTAGFLTRERVLRLAGLALLFLCILKLFVYDLRELEALGRIMSFVVLGLVLLGVSWTYTKYKEQIQRLL